MSWPLRVRLDGQVLSIPGPGGYGLPAPAPADTDPVLAVRRSCDGVAAGWVPADGGLLGNLRLWENILLATQWHAPASPAALEARLSAWLARFGMDAAAAAAWVARSPAMTPDDDRLLAGWLRVLLARPRLVLLEGDAWPSPGVLADLVAEELGGSAFLVVDGIMPEGFLPLSPAPEADLP